MSIHDEPWGDDGIPSWGALFAWLAAFLAGAVVVSALIARLP